MLRNGAHGSVPLLWSQRLRRFSPADGCAAGTAGGGGNCTPEALVGRASNSRSSSSLRSLSAMFCIVLSRSRASCCSRMTSAYVRMLLSGVLSPIANASFREGDSALCSRRRLINKQGDPWVLVQRAQPLMQAYLEPTVFQKGDSKSKSIQSLRGS